jgi:uncharacterized membrane protein
MKLKSPLSPPGRARSRSAGRHVHLSLPARFLLRSFVAILFLYMGAGLAMQTWAQTPLPAPTTEPGIEQVAPGEVPAEETLEAQVLQASPVQPCADQGVTTNGSSADLEPQRCQKVEVLITKGSLKGKKVIIDEGRLPVASKADVTYQPGDKVLVDYLHGAGQPAQFFITDFIRTPEMLVLALVFMAVAVIFGGFRGFTSMLGLAISFAVLVFFMLPRIVAGDDPVLITIAGSLLIMLVTLYLSHGFNRKTTAALFGTAISLLLTGLLALVSMSLIKLSGGGSDEATILQVSAGGAINMRGLLLGGIIIGALGVLNDVTIGQASAVFELHNVDPSMSWQRLFGHVSNIGRDHIAATVNTLVLAYAGASLPLLILFVIGNDSWDRVLNQEVVAEEVVRTLVGSIGLIASVPITTWLASLIAVRTRPQAVPAGEEAVHSHAHHH